MLGRNAVAVVLIALKTAAAGIILFLPSLAFPQDKPVRRVLIIYEVGTSHPAIPMFDDGVRAGLENSPFKIEFYREYMDTTLFPDPADQERFREFYVRKYQDRKPDAVITFGPSPLRFVMETREKNFHGVPVFHFLGATESPPPPSEEFTGIEDEIDAGATLEAALRLKPATKHVVVVGGMSPVNRRHNGLAKQQLQAYENGLDISYLTQVTMPELLERLKTLPDDSIVIFTSFTVDAAGKRFIAATEAVPMIIAASRAPVFSLFDLFLSHGEVGGKVSSVEGNGRLLGELALKSFRGEKSVAPSRGVSRYMFDRRALQRWKLSEKDLPPGSIVIHGQPTTWELYRSYIVAAVSLILVEAFLITALLRQRKKRRLAESELRLALLSVRESEQRFRLVANSAPVLIWMSGPDKLCNYFNQGWLDFTGQTLESQLGAGWTDGIHSDDRKNCLETYESSFDGRQPFRLAYRLRRHDGEYRWVLDTGVPVYEPDGTFNGYIGSCVDITDSKRAEEALASVGHRLIEAHEEERSRIARELHDDINQQMAMIAIEIDRLSQALPEGAQQVRDQVAQIQLRIQEVGKDIQSLSHRLHSSKLDLLGLAGAAKSFCQEMSEKHKIEIDLHEEGTLRTSQETGLCLFRVLQEALHNAVKYSDAKTFKVELIEKDAFVHLMVKDSGAGFNQQHLADHPGLGLISMRERIQMVGGEFLIESELGEGTTVRATVPSHSTPPTARKATRNAILKAG